MRVREELLMRVREKEKKETSVYSDITRTYRTKSKDPHC